MAEKHYATMRYLRVAPRKVRSVGDTVKGLPVLEAEAQLLYHRRRSAAPILKLLRSAVSNAKNNKKVDPATLVIENIRVDAGPMLKRSLPRARGMATLIQKKMSHVTIVLAEKTDVRAARFTIMPKKKTKIPKSQLKKPKTKTAQKETETSKKRQSPGFFQRVFSRKAGMGK